MTRKPTTAMSLEELVQRGMDRAHWGAGPMPKRRVHNRALSEKCKNDPEHQAQLAAVRTRTQLGEDLPDHLRCTAIAKATGTRCRRVRVQGRETCFDHTKAKPGGMAYIRALRVSRGAPEDRATRLARRNLRAALRQNKVPFELVRMPLFQKVARLVAPTWFGSSAVQLGEQYSRRELGQAALLLREMVLAYLAGQDQGDWQPWAQAVMKARALGFQD